MKFLTSIMKKNNAGSLFSQALLTVLFTVGTAVVFRFLNRSGFRVSFCFLFFSVLFRYLPAQTTTNSPYSIYGLGELESPAFSSSLAMGGAKYSLAFPYSVNIANPASYGFLFLPTFDVGISSNFLFLSYNDSAQKVNNTYFKNLALSFPVSKRWWASSFGLVPYSKMGYNITARDSVSNFGAVDYSYRGSGGLNRFFIGNTFNVLKDSVQQFSVGANVSYLFGSLFKTSRVMPEASILAYNTKYQTIATIGDFLVDAGILFSRKVNNNWNVVAGGDYEFAGKLKASKIILAESYTGSGLSEEIKDTIALDTIIETVDVPWKMGGGLSFYYKNQWIFSADYSLQDWSQFTYFGKNAGLAKQQQFNFGIQYNYNEKERGNILKAMSYRAGFRYAESLLLVKNSQLKESGITFGIGIPMGEKTNGSLNLSFETGVRGENKNGLVGERFTNITIGFAFTPSYYDRWFLKPKFE